MSASSVQSEMYVADWQLDFGQGERPAALQCDPNIDDPVNDTGCGARRGDLQLSEEFACLLGALTPNGEEI